MDYIAHQPPLSMEFSRQEYWSGLPFPSSGDLPDPGIKSTSPALACKFFSTEPPGKPINLTLLLHYLLIQRNKSTIHIFAKTSDFYQLS